MLLLLNAHDGDLHFVLPPVAGTWRLLVDTHDPDAGAVTHPPNQPWLLHARSLSLLVLEQHGSGPAATV